MANKKLLLERISALPGMDETKVVYRGYTIRWTGFNQKAPDGYGYRVGTRVGQFIARIENYHGDSIYDAGYYQQVARSPIALPDEVEQRKVFGAARLIGMIDTELNKKG